MLLQLIYCCAVAFYFIFTSISVSVLVLPSQSKQSYLWPVKNSSESASGAHLFKHCTADPGVLSNIGPNARKATHDLVRRNQTLVCSCPLIWWSNCHMTSTWPTLLAIIDKVVWGSVIDRWVERCIRIKRQSLFCCRLLHYFTQCWQSSKDLLLTTAFCYHTPCSQEYYYRTN